MADAALLRFDPGQPFTREQARAAGLTWRYIQGPRCQTLLPGVYVAAELTPTPALLARAALMLVPSAVGACHLTAAAILELPVPMTDVVHVLQPSDAPRVRRQHIRVHRGEKRLSMRDGVSLTTALETFVDVAADVSLVDAVVLGDAIVGEGYASMSALRRAAADMRSPRAARVRGAAALVRPRVDSPQETRLRLLMIFNGLPEPVTGYEVSAAGRTRRLDAAYPDLRVAAEYDGRHHVERDLQWSADIERHEELGEEKWRIVTVTGLQLWDPERVIVRVRRALENAGAQLPPSSQEWRRHLPTRRKAG